MPFSTGAQRQSVVMEAQQLFGVGAIGSLVRSTIVTGLALQRAKAALNPFLGWLASPIYHPVSRNHGSPSDGTSA